MENLQGIGELRFFLQLLHRVLQQHALLHVVRRVHDDPIEHHQKEDAVIPVGKSSAPRLHREQRPHRQIQTWDVKGVAVGVRGQLRVQIPREELRRQPSNHHAPSPDPRDGGYVLQQRGEAMRLREIEKGVVQTAIDVLGDDAQLRNRSEGRVGDRLVSASKTREGKALLDAEKIVCEERTQPLLKQVPTLLQTPITHVAQRLHGQRTSKKTPSVTE